MDEPSRWSLISEGGKNLVLRDDLGSGRALRLRKISEPESIDSVSWRRRVLERLVPKAHLPLLTSLSVRGEARERFRQLVERIEMQRSLERREEGRIDVEAEEIWETMDLTAGQGVCIEIKPKWLYLPNPSHLSQETVGLKTSVSRYRMHRVHKLLNPKPPSNGPTSEAQSQDKAVPTSPWLESLYEPTQLLSRPREQIQRLYEEWKADPKTNNLKIFLGGRLLDSSKTSDIEALTSHLGDLSLPNLVASSWDSISPLLTRLKRLQSTLDPLNIEGLAKWWQAQTGSPLGQVEEGSPHFELLKEPSLEEYAEVAELKARLLDDAQDEGREDAERQGGGGGGEEEEEEEEEEAKTMTLRQGVLAFLLSAMFKDCSLMVRFPTSSPSTAQSETSNPAQTDAGKDKAQAQAYLVDLDPKPHTRLAKYQALDLDIVRTFAAWAKEQGL